MSYEAREKEQAVKDFLKTVEEKLPGWLKEDKNELQSIMSDLEEHIWDKAGDIAEENEPSLMDVQQAILGMGSPHSIAREYKKRGTPKYFLSEELFPWYLKTLRIATAILVAVNLISFVIGIFSSNLWGQAILDLLSGLWGSFITVFALVTIIFVVFSMEGFLPQDFKKLMDAEKEKEMIKVSKGGLAYKKPKPPLKMGDFLAGGIFGVVFGILLITQPIPAMITYLSVEMLSYLAVVGIFTLLGGIVDLIKALSGLRAITMQRILMGVNIVLDIAMLPVILTQFGIALDTTLLMYPTVPIGILGTISFGVWFPILVVLGTVVGTIEKIYKISTLRHKYNSYIDAL